MAGSPPADSPERALRGATAASLRGFGAEDQPLDSFLVPGWVIDDLQYVLMAVCIYIYLFIYLFLFIYPYICKTDASKC